MFGLLQWSLTHIPRSQLTKVGKEHSIHGAKALYALQHIMCNIITSQFNTSLVASAWASLFIRPSMCLYASPAHQSLELASPCSNKIQHYEHKHWWKIGRRERRERRKKECTAYLLHKVDGNIWKLRSSWFSFDAVGRPLDRELANLGARTLHSLRCLNNSLFIASAIISFSVLAENTATFSFQRSCIVWRLLSSWLKMKTSLLPIIL